LYFPADKQHVIEIYLIPKHERQKHKKQDTNSLCTYVDTKKK